MFEYVERIRRLPPYLFAEIDRLKEEVAAKGIDIIDLGVGDPDMPTPSEIVNEARKALGEASNHQYPSYAGMLQFRTAVADWYSRRFGVKLDPCSEVLSLIGSKEGIAHLPFAFVERGDVVLIPDPGYPVYATGTILAEGEPFFVPLREDIGFLPDIDSIPLEILNRAKIMFVNYPNNPTSAEADEEFYGRVVELAGKFGFIVASDNAYSEIYYGDHKPISFLEVGGAKDVGVEFHSLSKTFNMTGWRIGFVVGNREVVGGLGKVKTNVDSGVFQAVQCAGIYALENSERLNAGIRSIFEQRRDKMSDALREAGFEFRKPDSTFYFWVKVPRGYSSSEFAKKLLEGQGVVVTPGNGFGEHGEGYFRISITNPRIEEAADRIRNAV